MSRSFARGDHPSLFAPPPPSPPPEAGFGRDHDAAGSATRRRFPSPPALRLCVLGSGSGGNATVLAHGQRALLVDAGFGPRTTAKRLAQARLTLADLAAVCVTHFDRDHFRPTWIKTLLALNLPLWLHRWHLPDLGKIPGTDLLHDAGLVRPFGDDPFTPAADTLPITAAPIRLQHDRQGTIGYRFTCTAPGGGDVGYATDLGHAPAHLIAHLAGVDVLCIESNYDHHMTIHSPRPSFVNRRNLSDSGHLSNDQAFEAVQRITDAAFPRRPQNIVLLHRSSQCNHEMKVARTFERDPRFAGRVVMTHQRRRTRWLTVKPRKAVHRAQLALAM